MSFFVSDELKDRISDQQFDETPQKWVAFVMGSGRAFKILEYVPENNDCLVKLEVTGQDLVKFISNEHFIDYLEISGEQFKIKDQKLIKFISIDNASTYITENYLRSP